MGENPSHHVFVDCNIEGQGDLFSDSRTAPAGIPLLHFDDRVDEFCTRSLRAGFAIVIRDRKSTRLNSSHSSISYAVFCLKKNEVASERSCESQRVDAAQWTRAAHQRP